MNQRTTAATIPAPCLICACEEGRELYHHRGRIVSCARCGFVHQDPIPSTVELDRIYRSAEYFQLTTSGGIGYRDYFADKSMYALYFERKFQVLAQFAVPPGRLLEIGSAAGFAMEAARARGWHVRGMELSPTAVEYARSAGLDVLRQGVEDLEDESRWDVVVAFQTIEHLVDARAALRRIRRALKPSGVLMLTTPNHGSLTRRIMRRWWLSYRSEHLHYFDRSSVSRLLKEEGFGIEYICGDDPLQVPIARLVERAAHYYAGIRFEVGLAATSRIRLPVWLGDMQLVARRS